MAVSKKKLKSSEVKKKLGGLSDWVVNAGETQLSKTFPVASFVGGLGFVAKVAVHAEIMGHHPNIELTYGKVKVKLSTHDVKGLTGADFELAKRIDNITIR